MHVRHQRSTDVSNTGSRPGIWGPLNQGNNHAHQLGSSQVAPSMATPTAQERWCFRRAAPAIGLGREPGVHYSCQRPGLNARVEFHVEDTSPLMRATIRTETSTGPVAKTNAQVAGSE